MKAYPIIWKNPEFYDDHIVMIGSFHLICAYLKMIGKKMNESGLVDVLLEAGVMSVGSMNGVMSAKNYSCAINCHKVMAESLEVLLLDRYLETRSLKSLPGDLLQAIDHIINERSSENLDAIMQNKALANFLEEYSLFRQQVRGGSLGKTAQFWLTYMHHVSLVLSLQHAVKINDYYLYGACLSKMVDLFFSFDGQNYARYLCYFSLFLVNIEETHPGATELLKLGAISVARSFIPANRCAVDKTIEETFMRHAKSQAGPGGRGAGISGLLNNYEAYRRWARTADERSRYVEVMLQMANMSDGGSGRKHRDTRPSQVKKGEKAAFATAEAIQNFMDPFQVEVDDKLYCISSGAAVPLNIESDIMNAELYGTAAKEAFISGRLRKNEQFFEPIKRLNQKTFADIGKASVVKTSSNREVQYKQQANVAFQLLVLSQEQSEKIDVRELMKYPLMPVPSSIGTPNGYLLKTDKSKGFTYLTKELDNLTMPSDAKTLNVEDGNAIFYCMKEVPATFKQICEKIYDVSIVGKSDLLFSTDMYKENSIKSVERTSRGSGQKRIIKGESTKRPENWKSFLSNDSNKQQLVRLLLKVWSSGNFG